MESIEEAFLERNYGSDYGELYKPDSMSMGGGRGNGGKFNMDDWTAELNEETISEIKDTLEKTDSTQLTELLEKFGYSDLDDFISALENADNIEDILNGADIRELSSGKGRQMPQNGQGGMQPPNGGSADGEMPQTPDGGHPAGSGFQGGEMSDHGGPGGGMGSDDVKLIYSDDEYDSYTNIFDNAKTDITDADKDRLIQSLKQLNNNENIDEVVNIDEVIRYFVVHNFVCNFDSYTGSMIHNYYLYEEDGQLSMIPWDYNLAFGGFQGSGDASSLVNYPIDSPVSGGTVDSRPMLAWIFSNEEYTELYHAYFAEFIESYFDSGYFSEMIESVREMIAPFVENDATKFCTYEEFQKGVDALKEFCLLRAESISGQLDGTIASTSDGQTQDGSALIDASALDISDMGSMEHGMGGRMDRPDGQNDTAADTPPDGQLRGGAPPDLPQNEQPSDSPQNKEVKSVPDTAPGETGPADTQRISTESWITVSISCLVLIAAILIAMRYQKRS